MRRRRPTETVRPLIAEAALASDELAKAVREYLDERDNPAPDYTMRRILMKQMRGALDRYDATRRVRGVP